MAKRNVKSAARRTVHDDYELPDELDFGKLKLIGFGTDALEQYSAQRKLTVQLDTDVARVFSTSEAVNGILRAIIHGLVATKKRRRSA